MTMHIERKPLHTALISAAGAHRKRSMQAFQAMGLSEGQPKVLLRLYAQEGVLQKELAGRCGVEPATMTSLLHKLRLDGLIRKEETRVSGGKRAYRVYLTPEGRKAAEGVQEIIEILEEQSYRGFCEAEKNLLQSLLARIEENISE